MTNIEIEIKEKSDGTVNAFFPFNEGVNNCASSNGAKFTKFTSGRKGWKFTAQQFSAFKSSLWQWGYEAEFVDGNAPKPESESEYHYHENWPTDGEKFDAFAHPTDAFGNPL
jgi:hypothetical protein